MMRLPMPHRIKRFFWSFRSEARNIYALIVDPVFFASYYPSQKRKPEVIIAAEILWWWMRFREVNYFYYLYGLDRAGVSLKTVIPKRRFRAMRDSTNLHPPILTAYYRDSYNFVCIMRDKVLFSQVAASVDVPTPKSLAICSPTSILWMDSNFRMPVEKLTSDTSLDIDCVCEPVDGIMGSNVFLLKVEQGRIFIDHAEATIDELKRRLSARHLLQPRLVQHPDLARLHRNSVNTLRLTTFNTNGRVTLFSAAIRIGTNGRPTDNWAAGGIIIAIDYDKGILHGDGYLKPAFGKRLRRHPDTGVVFEGFPVPYFEQAVAMVCKLHDRLPGLHSVGWDIAITSDGPVVVEGNDDWDGDIPMVLDPDFRKKFIRMFLEGTTDR